MSGATSAFAFFPALFTSYHRLPEDDQEETRARAQRGRAEASSTAAAAAASAASGRVSLFGPRPPVPEHGLIVRCTSVYEPARPRPEPPKPKSSPGRAEPSSLPKSAIRDALQALENGCVPEYEFLSRALLSRTMPRPRTTKKRCTS